MKGWKADRITSKSSEQTELSNLANSGEAGDKLAQSRELTLLELSCTVDENLRILMELANDGDELSFNLLVGAIEKGVNFVKDLASRHPTTAKTIAAKRVSWPVNITNDPGFPDLDAIRKQLLIGSARVLGFNLEVRPDYKSTTACREITVISILTIQAFSAIRDAIEDQKEADKLLKQFERIQSSESKAEQTDLKATRNLLGLVSRKAAHEATDLHGAFAQGLKRLTRILGIPELTKSVVTPLIPTLKPFAAGEFGKLSEGNLDQWSAAIIHLLQALAPEGPHKVPALYDIGKFKALKYFLRNKDRKALTRADLAEAQRAMESGRAARTVASNVLDGLRQRVRETLAELVKRKPVEPGESSPDSAGRSVGNARAE